MFPFKHLEFLCATGKPKEAAVLSNASLTALGNEIAAKGLVLGMYLNIPTTRLVRLHLAGLEKGQSEGAITVSILLLWKQLRVTAKEKEKVQDLERALKEAGKVDHADVLMDRFQNDMELAPDCFPNS
jgi:hypothetical protein